MQLLAEETFNDECTLRRATGFTQDRLGQRTVTYVEYERVPCGLSLPGSVATNVFEREVDQATVLQADAVLRISLDQDVGVKDEVIVRGKTYQVDGVFQGKTVKILPLKSMATEEA